MTAQINCNCIICAEEFNPSELHNVVLSQINKTKFKICEGCLRMSDPGDDYKEVRSIVDTYLSFSDQKKERKLKKSL